MSSSNSFTAHRRNYDFGVRLRAAMEPLPPPSPPLQQQLPPPPSCKNSIELGSGIFDRFRYRETTPAAASAAVSAASAAVSATPAAASTSPPPFYDDRAAVVGERRASFAAAVEQRPWAPPPPPPRERRRHCRAVSGYRKRYVAAGQKWMCAGRCGQLLPASFEVDHIVRLDRGGDNSVTNLVALCRNCHGHKTFLEML